jgi:hypothetical protein
MQNAEERLNEVVKQVEFCNNMTIVLCISFYMVILAALLCSYIFIRSRMDDFARRLMVPPSVTVHTPQNIELERLLAKLIERLPLPSKEVVVAPAPAPAPEVSVAAEVPAAAPAAAPAVVVSSPPVEVTPVEVEEVTIVSEVTNAPTPAKMEGLSRRNRK